MNNLGRIVLLLLLAACEQEQEILPPPPPPCPSGTVKEGSACVGNIPPPCEGACAPDSCIRGKCAPAGTPDLSGFWSGRVRILYDCGFDGYLFSATVPFAWTAEQTGAVVVFTDGLGVVRTATTSTVGFELPLNRESTAFMLDANAAAHVAYHGNVISGPVSGEFTEHARTMPSSPNFVPGYSPPCATGPSSVVRMERTTMPLARDVPASFEGRWSGSLSLIAGCVGTRDLAVIQPALSITSDLIQWPDGRVEGMIEIQRGGRTWLMGQVQGRAEGDRLRLGEGLLDGNGINLHLERPPDGAFGEWGAAGRLSWNGAVIDGEIAGWMELADPDVPYPCVLEDTVFRLERMD